MICSAAFRSAALWLSLAFRASALHVVLENASALRLPDDVVSASGAREAEAEAEAESVVGALEAVWADGAGGRGSSLWMDWGLQGIENGTCKGYDKYREKIASENEALAPSTELGATPRIIHHIWANRANPALPPAARETLAAWKRHFPEGEWEYMLWSDEGIRALIRDHYPWFLGTFDGYPFDQQRVDAVRYFILYHHGGLYADLDFEPRTNFWEGLPKYKPAVVESPYTMYEAVQNSLMSSPRGHPFWQRVFSAMERNKRAGFLYSTSDKMLQTVLQAESCDGRRGVKCGSVQLLPCFIFQRLTLAEDNAQNRSAIEVTIHGIVEMWKPIAAMKCGFDTRGPCQVSVHSVHMSYLKQVGLKELIRRRP